ncbi:alpha/beta hydrolase [Niallia sp. 01092]|uniref:alpha/beta hydrolase n=1 Tax=unclassified Niallia TaxID=2837522 RepID=UPI003FCFB59A
MFKHIKWQSEQLALSIDYPNHFNEEKKYDSIIICHGFIGSRIGVDRLFVKAGQHFTKEDYVVFRFDYSGCGESTGNYGKYGMVELLDQTKTILDYVSSLKYVRNIILVGHSLGGAVSALTAAVDPRINTLVQWAAVGEPYHNLAQIFGENKVHSLKNCDSIDYHGFSFTDYYFQSMKNYHPLTECSRFTGDVLLIHGTDDEDIPYDYMEQYETNYLQRKSGSVETYTIPNGDHTFSTDTYFNELINRTVEWLLKMKTNLPVS